MAGTLKLTDIAHSSGAGTITVDSLATLAVSTGKLLVGGTAITSGSSNILRKTADYTIVTGDVSGKSELVITASAAASTRTITLPAVAAVGMSTCIITIVADADATSTYKLMVQDSASAEVWTGYQKNDFVRLIVSNSVWVVLDHKETMFSSRSFTSDLSVAASATVKPTGYTNVTDIGQVWDNTNNKLVAPFAGIWDLNWRLSVGSLTSLGFSPDIYVGGSVVYYLSTASDASGYQYGKNMASLRVKVAASTDIEFYVHNMYSSGARVLGGNASAETGFDGTFTRTY
jgi:hypothetical protein